ncbi:Uncharacterized protein PBTT_02569 [Plasmodiophora brassicae]|nr:hypothetical protein PBRA_006315 [Plasmodiophora brassicae]
MDPSDPANASPPEAGRSRFRSQRQFFSFMRHTLPRLGLFDIKPLPQDKEWRESSCSSNIFARRSKDIDKALARCNDWRRISNVLINRSLVLCEDDAECNQSLIQFGFLGVSEIISIDVGKFAVVSPWKAFSRSNSAWSAADWSGAMHSRSIAKELMQSTPDTTALMNGDAASRLIAKTSAQKDYKRLYQELVLSEFFKTHSLALDRIAGCTFSWQDICTKLNRDPTKAATGKAVEESIFVFEPTIDDALADIPDGDLSNYRLVYRPDSWVDFLRFCISKRLEQAKTLETLLDDWNLKHPTHAGGGRGSSQVTAFLQLTALIQLEINLLDKSLVLLDGNADAGSDEDSSAGGIRRRSSMITMSCSAPRLTVASHVEETDDSLHNVDMESCDVPPHPQQQSLRTWSSAM